MRGGDPQITLMEADSGCGLGTDPGRGRTGGAGVGDREGAVEGRRASGNRK
jgi:hypothetical protein